ncbi:Rap1a/Tai family immunity protein [Zavarzinia sp. CC-PAN008]|uniref:Rap1a/Tai family immunity protein n=1 Tax=Zavarzinia sp. CC-PAN008 TaxID=3243332 RepID=UPI003F742A6B
MAAAIVLSAAAPTQGTWSVRELASWCRGLMAHLDNRAPIETFEPVKGGMCIGVMNGTLVSLNVWARELYCLPPGVSNEQAARIFIRYADQHPEVLHEEYPKHLFIALGAAFVCRDGQSR